MTIGIVDYGAGNLRSVKKALDYLGFNNRLVKAPDDMEGLEKLILPGVGAFGHAMAKIKASGLESSLRQWLNSDRPFLGICLGLQLLFEASSESPGVEGLSFFSGKCLKFEALKIPQIGWNDIEIKSTTPLLRGIPPKEYFYFVHSYFVLPVQEDIVLARTSYFNDFVSIAGTGRIFGVQFHPEKSGLAGLRILQNWIELC